MTAKLKRHLRRIEAWLDERPPRERVLLCVASLLVIGSLWLLLVMDPVIAKRKGLQAQLREVEAEVQKLELQGAEIRAAHDSDPNRVLRERSATLREEIRVLDEQIHEHTVTMVPPREMARFLEEMLLESSDLHMVRLENLGAQPMLDDGSGGEEGQAVRTGVFRHVFEVELRGRYLSTLRYLEALESLPWNFFWEGLDYEVDVYPEGRARIRAYTLGNEEGWVGA